MSRIDEEIDNVLAALDELEDALPRCQFREWRDAGERKCSHIARYKPGPGWDPDGPLLCEDHVDRPSVKPFYRELPTTKPLRRLHAALFDLEKSRKDETKKEPW